MKAVYDVIGSFEFLADKYREVMETKRDRRVDGYPLMSSPLVPLLLCSSYVYFVRVAGPSLMAKRSAFNLRKVMIFYNAVQAIFSALLFYMALKVGWIGRYSFKCEPVDYTNTFSGNQAAWVSWLYYISKYTEFLDTIFFVLRKRFDHVTVLHVVHHGMMPFSVWWGARFFPGGHSMFFGLINTYVHMLMYTYYLFAALGSSYSHLIWWKKYLTTFQMMQFVAVGIHSFQLFFRECNFPTASAVYIGLHGLLYLALFTNFYIQHYLRKNTKPNSMENVSRKELAVRQQTQMNGIHDKVNGTYYTRDGDNIDARKTSYHQKTSKISMNQYFPFRSISPNLRSA